MDKKLVGERLKKAAKNRGLTQADVLQKVVELGYKASEGTISHYFNGETAPRLELITALAIVLDVSIDSLVRGDEPAGDRVMGPDDLFVVRAFRESGLSATDAVVVLKSNPYQAGRG